MPKKYNEDFKVISCRVDKKVLDGYERLFPDTLRIFLPRAIKFACQSQSNFDMIFFDEQIRNGFLKMHLGD